MAKKTPASTENSQDSAQDLQQSAKQTAVVQADAVPLAEENTLPFAQPRDELINKFRANAVPREADYKQLLDQHYDVAGALGMAHAQDNRGDKTGNGLILGTSSKKLEVLAKPQGGLHVDTAGVRVEHDSSLTVGSEGLALNVNYHPTAATALAGEKGLTTNAQGQLSVSLNHNPGEEADVGGSGAAGVIKASNGLWINVGASNDQSRKGLKSYKGNSNGNVLGVDHDSSLMIDSAGKLGINTLNMPVSGATLPLVVSSGQVSINYNTSLSVNNGVLGVSSDRREAVRIYGRIIGAEYYGFGDKFIIYTCSGMFLILATVLHLSSFNSVLDPEAYKKVKVKNESTGYDLLAGVSVYGGGVYGANLRGGFGVNHSINITGAYFSPEVIKLAAI